ncbi:retrovirus-related pol polyprotein from transposon TNT 1-94 [Tanacetum coccineum]
MMTLADKAILLGVDNRPPMLEKDMYDSWKSRMELYMMNRQHGRMILESVENGPLIWPTIEENRVTRPKKYSELSATDAIQADCDNSTSHARNFIDETGKRVCRPSRYPTTKNQLRNSSNPRQQATINDERVTLQPTHGRQISFATGTSRTYTPEASGSNSRKQRTVICYNCKEEGHMSKQCTKPKRKQDDSLFKDKELQKNQATQTIITHNAAYQADDLDAYDSDCDQLNTVKVALMANLSHNGTDALAEVHNPDNVDNNMINQAAVQNSSSSTQQDALILYVIEQLKTQVVNCTKINLDNKSVNDTLTAELERYKEQVKVLKEGQNLDLKNKDNVSDSFTLLKNDFKKEESRNIDREIALEKRIKQLDNIVFKRDQSAQTKAQQLEPKLYDGNVIKNTSAIVIPDSEETLVLAEESRSKMLLKQQDPMMLEKKVNTTPVDYVVLNQLSQDFETRFVPQTELSAEQAFWSQNSMNSSDPTPSNRPTKVEVPKELPKVSMVNTSLKKLKHHLAGFDVVVKERTTTTTIIEGSWGAVEQHRLESKTFEVKMNQVLNENERLLEHINKDIMNIIVNSSVDNTYVDVHECKKCLKHETKLLNKKDFVEKEIYDKMFRSFITLEKYCISLEVDTQLNHEFFQKDISVSNQSAPSFDQYFELNELNAQSQEKDTEQGLTVTALKDELRKLKGKGLADNVVSKHTIDPEMLKIDVEYLNPRLLNNMSAHSDYLKHTRKEATILREIVE